MQRLKLYYREKLLEILKECSKKSAEAFSLMIHNQEVIPNLTSINLKPMSDLFMLPENNIFVMSDISGELSGTMIISFKGEDGLKIINTILGRDPELVCDLGEEEKGILKEYMSVVGGTYLSEFGDKIGLKIMPEAPNFEGKFKEVSDLIITQLKAVNEKILFINSSMNIIALNADAIFYVLFEENSLNLILNEISKGSDDPFEEEL